MHKKHQVLYVDDEEINLRIFKDTFRRDFEIHTAISGFDALKVLEKESVDIVITDQRMPGMTGVELLEKINSMFPDIPPNRLMISGYSEDEDIKKAFREYRLSRFVSKPWKYDELKEIINNAVKQDL
ncbi:MAG: response regulator [Chloroflexia bacterium]|nr:response regulator [Chloroflexia bacterium]